MSKSPPALDLSWMELEVDHEGFTALRKQANEIAEIQKSDLPDEEPLDAIDQWMTELRERVQRGQEAGLDLLKRAGYTEVEARDLAAASHDAPTGEELMAKAGCRPRVIQQGKNGVGPG